MLDTETDGDLFLLGGSDLEMITIKNLLIRYRKRLVDLNLQWKEAYLSRYKEVLQEYVRNGRGTIYGIELIEDITPPDNYVRIDHHNDYTGREASLEQIAKLLGHPLSRHERLVAANDVAYIPGMQAMDASPEEVNEIRRMDRQAQGASEKDEKLAKESLAKHRKRYGNLTVVYSLTPFFSTINDRLFPYGNLLVYTSGCATYYGEKVPVLKEKFQAEVKRHAMYYGGKDSFFGIAQGFYTPEQIEELVDGIIRLHQ